MATRKELRDSIKSIIETVYSGTVNTGRRLNYTGDTPPSEFVAVVIPEGNNEDEGVFSVTQSRAVITIYKAGATDDELDAIADPISDALRANRPTGASGLVKTSFSYGDDEDKQYEKLHLIYSLIYQE